MNEVSVVRTARGRLHIVLFVIGLTMLISGVAVVIEGPNVMVKWHPQSAILQEDAILDVHPVSCRWDGTCEPGRDTYPWGEYYDLVYMGRGAADARVEGNITGINGSQFNFVCLDGAHWMSWDSGGDTTGAFAEARNANESSFVFNLTREQWMRQLRFGVENTHDHRISTRLSAMLYWKEKEVIEPAMAGVGLFTLAKLSAVVGFILIVVAGVMKVRKLDEQPYRAPGS